jgi:RNA polymerase sigma-70 factor, ECF subfamily
MEAEQRAAFETEVRHLCSTGHHDQATEAAITGYGAEILGFLWTVLGQEEAAEEAFALFCEDLWRGLTRFEWRASLRTWSYTLARNAAHRLRSAAREQAEHKVPLSQGSVLNLAQSVRSRTLPYLRTTMKSEVARLRASLSEDDRALLVLRVDKELSWNEIALVTTGGNAPPGELAREAARLRKRFQLVKDKLAELARQRGLLDS